MVVLNKYPDFLKLIKFHGIEEEFFFKVFNVFIQICNFITYKKIPKNEYIVSQKDRDNMIIGVISGRFVVTRRDTNERSNSL
jgi:hypothetical protein